MQLVGGLLIDSTLKGAELTCKDINTFARQIRTLKGVKQPEHSGLQHPKIFAMCWKWFSFSFSAQITALLPIPFKSHQPNPHMWNNYP